MTKTDFKELIKKGPIILDGATGTNLMAEGMPIGVCPELWILEHPEVMKKLQQDYVAAGSQIVYAPTFTGNRIKLAEYGLDIVERVPIDIPEKPENLRYLRTKQFKMGHYLHFPEE